MKVFAEMRRILKYWHSGGSKWKSDKPGALVCFTYSGPLFHILPRTVGYFPPGFRRARSSISLENCFAGFQSLAARYDKTQYQEHLCILSATFSGYK